MLFICIRKLRVFLLKLQYTSTCRPLLQFMNCDIQMLQVFAKVMYCITQSDLGSEIYLYYNVISKQISFHTVNTIFVDNYSKHFF